MYSVIYEPKGRAREYSQLALNIFNGCSMGCEYCYVPRITRKKRADFKSNAAIRKDILKKIEKDLIKKTMNNDNRLVMLSFTSDVYQSDNDFNLITRSVLQLFNKYNQSFHILTKGGTKAVRDFDLYKKTDWFASTLTFYDENKSKNIEPKAALPKDRIEALKIAKLEYNIKTWVSFEPVLDMNDVFTLYDKSRDYVDFYKIGKVTSYEVDVDWVYFANKITDIMEKDKKPFFVKYDLRKHLKQDVTSFTYHREIA